MVTAKANTLLFEGWWKEEVVQEARARIPATELYRAYRKAMVIPMGEQAFTARLNGLGVKSEKVRGVRYRLGIRLRFPAERPAPVVQLHDKPPAAEAPPIVRSVPYVPGAGEPTSAVWLEFGDETSQASATIAGELFAERRRQVVSEGWDAAHDDAPHTSPAALPHAAAAYAYAAGQPDDCARFLELEAKLERPPIRRGWAVVDFLRAVWPWDPKWWKPNTEAPGWRRRCLVKAGALIIAAIEKLDRADAAARLTAEEQRTATGV